MRCLIHFIISQTANADLARSLASAQWTLEQEVYLILNLIIWVIAFVPYSVGKEIVLYVQLLVWYKK